ncbi:hypothetical protein VTK73DRAFT_1939 [Phialemonium thermophilum]|uniref:Uncharacterized protein n=1 Tax=Phialemonium thermophilum TaxID=223376 RepID=A0ABR3VST0_9PEZI
MGGADADVAGQPQALAAWFERHLQADRLQHVGPDGVGQDDALRHHVDHLLQDLLADGPEPGGVGHGLDGGVAVGIEDAAVRVLAQRHGRPDDERVGGVPVQVFGDDPGIERGDGGVGADLVLGDQLGKLVAVHAAQGVAAGGDLDHLLRGEAHAGELPPELVDAVLGLGHAGAAGAGGVDPASANGDRGPAAGAHRGVHTQGDEVGEAGARREVGRQEGQGGVEAGAQILAVVQHVLDGAVQAAAALGHVGGRHVVEAEAEPLGGVLPPGPRGLVGAGIHGVGEAAAPEGLELVHDLLELVGGRRPRGIGSDDAEQGRQQQARRRQGCRHHRGEEAPREEPHRVRTRGAAEQKPNAETIGKTGYSMKKKKPNHKQKVAKTSGLWLVYSEPAWSRSFTCAKTNVGLGEDTTCTTRRKRKRRRKCPIFHLS